MEIFQSVMITTCSLGTVITLVTAYAVIRGTWNARDWHGIRSFGRMLWDSDHWKDAEVVTPQAQFGGRNSLGDRIL